MGFTPSLRKKQMTEYNEAVHQLIIYFS